MKGLVLSLGMTVILFAVLAPVGCSQEVPGMQHAPSAALASDLTLEQLEQMALENNPTLAQGAAEIHAATGRQTQSSLYPNPTVGYQGEQIRGGVQRGGEQGFFVSQDIVLGGKLALNRKVREQEKKQAETEAEEQKLRVMNSVRLFYYRGLAAQEMVGVRRQLRQLAADAVETSHQLANVGQADQPDVLQAEVESEQAELAVVAAEQNQARVWKELAATVGKPELPMAHLAGQLEDVPKENPDQWVQAVVEESPAVRIAQLGVGKAEASLERARREAIPDLQLRAGMQQNRELDATSGRPIGLQGFAEAGVQIPVFNRNQGNVEAAKADAERARQELQRVQLVLRARSSALLENYATSRVTVERLRDRMLPRARKAYELYMKNYQSMAAAYPQVLIAQRTLFQLQADYISALETMWTNAIALKGFLLTDGLEAPTRAGEVDRPVREVNLPSAAPMQ
jgi:cobalt-zinc-cadmium efflux system outer membrane protein